MEGEVFYGGSASTQLQNPHMGSNDLSALQDDLQMQSVHLQHALVLGGSPLRSRLHRSKSSRKPAKVVGKKKTQMVPSSEVRKEKSWI